MQEPKQEAKSGGIFSVFKGMGGVSGWLRILSGKPRVPQIPEHQLVTKPDLDSEEVEEDRVAEDLKEFKGKVQEVVAKTTTVVGKAAENVKTVTATKKQGITPVPKIPKPIVKIFIGLLFLIILLFIISRVLTSPGNGGKPVKPSPTLSPEGLSITPSIIPYIPVKASLYADDEEVLNLERDISVLEREVATVSLKELGLQPPSLDFNVRF